MTQLLGFFWLLPLLSFSMCCKSWRKMSSTDSFCFAEVSKNVAFHNSASFFPSSDVTALSWCKSVLFPTRTIGTLKRFGFNWWTDNVFERMNSLSFSHDVYQLFVNDFDDLERLLTRDRVDQDVSMKVHGILCWKNRILILTSRVNQLHLIIWIVDSRHFWEGYGDKIEARNVCVTELSTAVPSKTNMLRLESTQCRLNDTEFRQVSVYSCFSDNCFGKTHQSFGGS